MANSNKQQLNNSTIRDNHQSYILHHKGKKMSTQLNTVPKWQQFMNEQPSFHILKNEKQIQKAKNIIENYESLKPIPQNLNQNEKKHSIKIVNKEQNINLTGASYLMSRSTQKPNDHLEKRHIPQPRTFRNDDYQRKHYEFKPSLQLRCQKINRSKNGYAFNQKVTRDFMSFERFDDPISQIADNRQKIKQKPNIMQMTSHEAGLQEIPKKYVSSTKIRQLVGNGLDRQPMANKSRRDDFRKSSIVFG